MCDMFKWSGATGSKGGTYAEMVATATTNSRSSQPVHLCTCQLQAVAVAAGPDSFRLNPALDG